MLKVDFHSHSADDPADFIVHSTVQLIDRAADLGFDALAITLHDRQLDLDGLKDHASRKGLLLLPGIEKTIDGRHVLLINFPRAAERIGSFDDLAQLKERHRSGLVVAPHPFYPHPSCLGRLLERHHELFDAVEVNAFYTSTFNFNQA